MDSNQDKKPLSIWTQSTRGRCSLQKPRKWRRGLLLKEDTSHPSLVKLVIGHILSLATNKKHNFNQWSHMEQFQSPGWNHCVKCWLYLFVQVQLASLLITTTHTEIWHYVGTQRISIVGDRKENLLALEGRKTNKSCQFPYLFKLSCS